MKRLRNLTNRLLATPCLVCFAAPAQRRGFCAACEDELPWQPPGCYLCGVALADHWPDETAPLCSRCRQQPPTFSRCLCTFAYEPPVAGMIRQFKDRAGFPQLRALSECFIEHFVQYHSDSAAPSPDLLLPVPLHASRLRARGFNQALLLARRLSRRTGIPVLYNSCRRKRDGVSQRGLGVKERASNMHNIFIPHSGAALTAGKRLAIIDDVVTTTATTQAMATVFHDCAAARIDVWALARSNHQPES